MARWFLYFSLLITCFSLISGCVSGGEEYVQNRTIDLPSGEPTRTAVIPTGNYTFANPFFDPEPFRFSDPRPRVVVVGHVEVRRDDIPVNDVGAFKFRAGEFKSNVKSFNVFLGVGWIATNTSEIVSFVSGEWFAGEIFAGERKLNSVYFADGGRSHPFCNVSSTLESGFSFSDTILRLDEPTKVYYLGHITLNEETSFLYRRSLDMTVRDRSDEFADELRALVGDRVIERALFPSCPD